LCLGRLSAEKGFDLALAALKILRQQFPEVRLLLAGDGRARTDLEQQANDLGIRDHVDFLGWVAPGDVPSLINTVTVVLMPSRQESLPLVALEAALMARPLVAARVGGLPEFIIHEHTGVLVEPENSQALADAVAILLTRSSYAEQLGKRARERARELFSWQSHVDSYDRLYRGLGKSSRRHQSIA
jgi:glycogen(starch) synthase